MEEYQDKAEGLETELAKAKQELESKDKQIVTIEADNKATKN